MALGSALLHACESASAAAPGPPRCQDFPARIFPRVLVAMQPFQKKNSFGQAAMPVYTHTRVHTGGGLGERPAKLEGDKLACFSLICCFHRGPPCRSSLPKLHAARDARDYGGRFSCAVLWGRALSPRVWMRGTQMMSVVLLLAMLGGALGFENAALRFPATTAGRVCAPRPALGLSMSISNVPTPTSRRQLLSGFSL